MICSKYMLKYSALGKLLGNNVKKNLGKYWISSAFNAVNDNANKKTGWSVPAGKGSAKLKRSPIAVNYLGTVADFKPNPFISQKQDAQRWDAFQKHIQANDKVLRRAIDILSQSDTGRYLLNELNKNGYSILFDARRTGMSGAGGLCDSNNKQIILSHDTDPYYVALVLGHEAVHAAQSANKNLFPSSLHRPEEGIKLSFAIEADAYAQQTQIAMELAHGSPKGPKNQITYKQPLFQMRRRFPQIVKSAESTFRDYEALTDGRVVSAAFRAFYDNPNLRSFYEDSHMRWAGHFAPKLLNTMMERKRNFSKFADFDYVKKCLTHMGKPYLKNAVQEIDFHMDKYSGVTPETNAKLDAFYQEHKPKARPRQKKEYGVYVKDSAAWVLGWKTRTGSIIVKDKKNKPPTKPPMRPPAA